MNALFYYYKLMHMPGVTLRPAGLYGARRTTRENPQEHLPEPPLCPDGRDIRRGQAAKRALDVVLGLGGLILLLPAAVIGAIAVMICSPGPWWHIQWRVGRDGVPFRMLKLRTMHLDADTRLTEHLARSVRARQEWAEEFKLTRDPRIISGVGRLLRRWSLDEYPQFWHVVRGDMSLVGPRPLPVYHLAAFSVDFRRIRQQVRPGMTGLWQVTSRGRGAIGRQEALDRYYIHHWSLRMDLSLLARTILAVMGGRGAR